MECELFQPTDTVHPTRVRSQRALILKLIKPFPVMVRDMLTPRRYAPGSASWATSRTQSRGHSSRLSPAVAVLGVQVKEVQKVQEIQILTTQMFGGGENPEASEVLNLA